MTRNTMLVLLPITITLEVALFFFLPAGWTENSSFLMFFGGYQIMLLTSIMLLYLKKFESFAITCILLLLVNFLTGDQVFSGDFKTLPPNFLKKIEVVGDMMPNFYGVNKISTDEKGFRSITTIDYNNKTTFRVFAIGGSTTEEIYVDDAETWTSLLARKINLGNQQPIEVINTGVSGLRVKHHLATMLETEKYHPDAYIFLVGVNDWNKHIKDLNGGLLFEIKNISSTLLWRGFSLTKRFIQQNLFNKSQAVIRIYGEYYSKQNDSLSKEDIRRIKIKEVDPDYKKILIKIADRCNALSYECFFVSQPSAYSYDVTTKLKSLLWMTPPNVDYTLDLQSLIEVASTYNAALMKIALDNEINFCDLAKEVPPSEKYFYDDVHFNENGSERVAIVLSECINLALINP